jgi:DNA (cytosine-5)-methyltransferase 1
VTGDLVDLFCGGGGVSAAVRAVIGRDVDVAVNHWPVAIAVHQRNHPQTRHLMKDIREVRPREACPSGRAGFIWASPDCRDHSRAKGGKPRENKLRALPDVVPEWCAELRPAMAFIENVPELQKWGPLDGSGKPIKSRQGEFFERWLGEFRGLGYQVDHRILDASHYGAPTRRKRLFVIARRDGNPIVWPERTHGPGLLPFHTAAECIDWSLPCPSIFEREKHGLKPLVEKTMWRIAQGLKRFVFDNPRPFIVKPNHGKWEPRHEDIDLPLSTVTATQRGHGLVVPVLQHSGNGERVGQRGRVYDIEAPLGTLVDGQKHALVLAWLTKYFGDPIRADGGGGVVVGDDLERPIGTVTARDHHGLSLAYLAKFRGTHPSQPGSASVEEPLPTISAGGIHVAEVRAFLTAYYGTDATGGQGLLEPMRTIRAKHCLGLVTVHGVDYQLVDIGFRMLQPSELLRAQFGKYAASYDMSAATTKADAIRLIGNSVPPELAEAVLRANLPVQWAVAA